jgi:hypothetical protein
MPSSIVEWVNAHLDQLHIAPTEVGVDQQGRLEEGRSTRRLGEAAALETLERVLSADTEGEALRRRVLTRNLVHQRSIAMFAPTT